MLSIHWIFYYVTFNDTVNGFMCQDFSFFFLQDSAQESVIKRDIHRTYPAHDYFKDTEGDGQESLYKICKVQSVLSMLKFHILCDFVLPC